MHRYETHLLVRNTDQSRRRLRRFNFGMAAKDLTQVQTTPRAFAKELL